MNIEDTVWRLIRIAGSERGRLTLRNGRLSFAGEKGTQFDVKVSEIGDVNFPWHYFGGGMKISVGSENYRFSFIEPHNDHGSVIDARETGAKWKAALAQITGTL